MYSGGGIKRNLQFYFAITVCEIHDLPVTVNKEHKGFSSWKIPGRCPVRVHSMEMREGTQQPVKVSFSCGQKRTGSSNLVSDGMIKQF